MSSSHRPSKGKDRAAEGDYAQSFASLSLSDNGDHYAPHSNSYESSHRDVYGSSYDQPYPGDDQYCWMAQSSQSSSAVYGGTPGYGNSYPTTSHMASSTGGYDYLSDYGSYDSDDVSVATSTRVPSSYEGGSVSGESDAHWTAASSINSTHNNQPAVSHSIQPPHTQPYRYLLPCEFSNLTGCGRVFNGDDEQGWMDHIEQHLQSKFPRRLKCWFCTDQRFDAATTSGEDLRSNYIIRMGHIRDHFVYDGFRREQTITDGYLVQHLFNHKIVDRLTYERILNPVLVPRKSDGPCGRYREGVAESTNRHHHRSEYKKDYNRDYPIYDHLRYRSKKSKRNRGRFSKLHPAAAVAPLNEAVSQAPAQDRRSSAVLENTSLASSRLSKGNDTSRHSASKHSGGQSIADVDDDIAASTVMNWLYNLDTGLEGWGSSESLLGFESPRSQGHSNGGRSSCPTDTSTSESGSFWLTEYSEEERKRLDGDHLFIQFKDLAIVRVFEAFGSWRGDNFVQDIPCDDGDEFNPTSNEGKGKQTDSETGKRKRADKSEINKEINNNSRLSSGCSKRRRTSDRQLTFACPYTKKDSTSYRDCYKYKLSRIRDVKQHLARCHRIPPYCPRCMGTFETEVERDEHIRDFSCPSRPLIRLDGITEAQKSQLAKKSIPNTPPEAQWFAVFDIVFPGHKPRPQSAYVDSELLQDITLYQDFLTSHGPRILSEFLTQRGAVTWNSPDDERDLAAFQQSVFEEGLGVVFEHWLARQSNSNNGATDVPSSSGSTNQLTPPSSSYSREIVGSTSVQDPRAVVTEGSDERPGGGPTDAHLDSEDVQEASADQVSFGEELDGSYILEHGNSDFLSGLTYDGSDAELTRLFMNG